MKKLDIECNNESCPLYIEGVEDVDDKRPVTPLVNKAVNDAKVERAAIEASEKKKSEEEKMEAEKRKREWAAAEHAKYDPFSGAKEKEAEHALAKQAEVQIEMEKMKKRWEKMQKKNQKKAEELENLENVVDGVEE